MPHPSALARAACAAARGRPVLLCAAAVALLCASASAQLWDPTPYDVTWLSATPFDGQFYADGMPFGNGRVAGVAWANTSAGSVDFYVRSPNAMHTDTFLFTIAKVSVAVSPNPFAGAPGAYFNQTHHLLDGSVRVLAGGTGLSDYLVALTLWADANSDSVVVTASSRDGVTPISLSVSVSTVRPTSNFTYQVSFQCNKSTSAPDVVPADPLPSPAPAGATVAIYHVNSIAQNSDFPTFEFMMTQQGLAPLLANFSDPMDGRIFGLGVVGAAGLDGSGALLARTSPSTLASSSPSPSFAVLVAVRTDADAKADDSVFLAGLAQDLAAPINPPSRYAAHAAWWASFWARSYVTLPPAPPPPPRVGVFPCGGAQAPAQTVSVNATTGVVTLPGGLCLTPSSDGTSVSAQPCTPATEWAVVPCTAQGCAAGEMWVRSTSQSLVLGLPGATCPWCDVWTPDDPTGQFKNELFYVNASDSTLRALCTNCADQCVTVVPSPSAGNTSAPSLLGAQYARSRFVFAAQSRNVQYPINFEGQLFLTQAGTKGPSDVDYRQWGSDAWLQNTRLPYGAMLPAGDFDILRPFLDWIMNLLPLARARTAALLPEEAGVFFTETLNVGSGLYQPYEYGCDASARPPGYPVWLEGAGEVGGWVRFDHSGNALGPEQGMLAISYYYATGDATYLPIATNSMDFLSTHYHNRSSDGKVLIWPTQVLETYWCEWPGWSNCVQNDMPAVAAMTALVQALLLLPDGLLTPAQKAAYQAFSALTPDLPLTPDGTMYAAAAVLSSGTHNSEVPDLFAVHPYRLISAGRAAVDPSVNLTIGRTTWANTPLAQANNGWYYGILQAALLGLANETFAMAQDRATLAPPTGYRYPAFAPHLQDYPPSADHYANMMAAVQLMLVQTAEDGPAGTIVLFPAWPCDEDVSFRLWAPLNTTVEVVYAGGKLVSLDVEPQSRAAAVRWANCVVA